MITVQDYSAQRGGQTLIHDVQFALYPKQVMALVGANGCGKSTLLHSLIDSLQHGDDRIEAARGLMVSALAQEITELDLSASDYVLGGHAELFQVITDLRKADEAEDFEAQMHGHERMHTLDGYRAESDVATILIGLGFAQGDLDRPVRDFSGGWRMRLNLARTLFRPSDLLMLDEPTNHLDMEAIFWLETYIKQYAGAILLVSHDRDFLDRTATHVGHIEHKAWRVYTGNYSEFEMLLAQHKAQQDATHRKQQTAIAHMMKYVDKNRAKASKAKQAQSRLKAIERMNVVGPVLQSHTFTFQFHKPPKMPDPMLRVERAAFGYGDKTVLSRVKTTIRPGQRIGLLGVNGAGKTTLIEGLCGNLVPQKGTIERPGSLEIGHFAQHQVDVLPLDDTPFTLMRDLAPGMSEKEIYSYLGRYGFSKEKALQTIGCFSGGEKSRLALGVLIWREPNLLLMDEPTNHLDLEVREALAAALQAYEGSLILVSHDRYLMRSLVDELWLVEGGMVSVFDGSIDEYLELAG